VLEAVVCARVAIGVEREKTLPAGRSMRFLASSGMLLLSADVRIDTPHKGGEAVFHSEGFVVDRPSAVSHAKKTVSVRLIERKRERGPF
jgi:hypothetical protein